jgi:DNA-directed RNA polymerase subunit RPC12/RpoP
MVTVKREIIAKDYQKYPRKNNRPEIPKEPPFVCDYCSAKINASDTLSVINRYYLACVRCSKNIKDTSQNKDV